MRLSKYQQLAFDKYKLGENIFITGAGGTGKTKLIREIYLDAINNKKKISVCAMTGCAAVLLQCNAKTIHSWSGIGMKKGPNEIISTNISTNKFRNKNWKRTDILVCDEVSMMSKKFFELLDMIGKKCNNNNYPFGGIQIIFSGDFYQLPPIGNNNDKDSHCFCFESGQWNNTFKNQIKLKKIFRQTDNVYTKILSQIRKGKITEESCTKLNEYINRDKGTLNIKPTILLPTKRKVDSINSNALSNLNSDEKKYNLKNCLESELTLNEIDQEIVKNISPIEIKKERDYLTSNINCEKELILKKGAQVMCIFNMDIDSDKPICNGSQGIIVDFDTNGHPLVEFTNGAKKLIKPHIWQSEKIPNIAVKQVPLILAWAITIHKSQGSTLDMAEIDIGSDIFECGQTYVALSRVKDLDGLYLKSFCPDKIKLNKKVYNFYKNMKPINDNSEDNITTDDILNNKRLNTREKTLNILIISKILLSIKDIADLRSLKESTIFNHICEDIKLGDNIYKIKKEKIFYIIYNEFKKNHEECTEKDITNFLDKVSILDVGEISYNENNKAQIKFNNVQKINPYSLKLDNEQTIVFMDYNLSYLILIYKYLDN